MVSARRSGSFSGNNNNKRSLSSDGNKPQSPKRHKVDNNGITSEKTENSKEVCTPATAAADPGECNAAGKAPAAGDGATSVKTEASVQAVAVTPPPLAEGPSPAAVLDKARSSFLAWNTYQKQGLNPASFEVATPCCKLLSQSDQNLNISITTGNFTIGSSRSSNFPLKDSTVSGCLCKIKREQLENFVVHCCTLCSNVFPAKYQTS